ncbi:unnamed protein product, partial [Rotaria sp. Silwood2]
HELVLIQHQHEKNLTTYKNFEILVCRDSERISSSNPKKNFIIN